MNGDLGVPGNRQLSLLAVLRFMVSLQSASVRRGTSSAIPYTCAGSVE